MDFDAFARRFVETHAVEEQRFDPDQPRGKDGRWSDSDPFDDPFYVPQPPKPEPTSDGTNRGDIRLAAEKAGWSHDPQYGGRDRFKNHASNSTIDVDYDEKTGELKSARWQNLHFTSGAKEARTTDPKKVEEWLTSRKTPAEAKNRMEEKQAEAQRRAGDLTERGKLADELSSQLDKELTASKDLRSLEVSDVSPFVDEDGTVGFTGGVHDPDFVPSDNAEGRPDAAQFHAQIRPDGVGEVQSQWDGEQERINDAENELNRALRRLLLSMGANRVNFVDDLL